jgi:hypothetical protein
MYKLLGIVSIIGLSALYANSYASGDCQQDYNTLSQNLPYPSLWNDPIQTIDTVGSNITSCQPVHSRDRYCYVDCTWTEHPNTTENRGVCTWTASSLVTSLTGYDRIPSPCDPANSK